MARFHGFTMAPQRYPGAYYDPDTDEEVADESRKYFVAVEERRVDELRSLLRVACGVFKQKCIYLNVGMHVEFVGTEQS